MISKVITEFQVFVDYTWPFFICGLVIRVVCWGVAEGVSWLKASVGGGG